MFDLVPTPLKNAVESVFNAPISWLTMMRDMLNNASVTAGKGIDLNNYFGFFGYMPNEWQLVVKSALASVTILAILFLVKAGWDMYLKVKASAKWW